MNEQSIGFIGGGNMATSLVGGLISGGFNSDTVWVSEPDANKRINLENKYHANIVDDNRQVVEQAKIVVFAVKPQLLRAVISELSQTICALRPLLVSIAAGIRERDIERWCGGQVALVRCMPNTPALVGSGATALHANVFVSNHQKDMAESIMRSVGLTVWVDNEDLLDSVTAISGSGPAYFFLLMEAMETAALDLGLDQKTARLLIQQTAFGAAKVALEIEKSPAELRRNVTSPGGTTERAIGAFEKGNLRQLVAQALQAAKTRSIELSNELGGD